MQTVIKSLFIFYLLVSILISKEEASLPITRLQPVASGITYGPYIPKSGIDASQEVVKEVGILNISFLCTRYWSAGDAITIIVGIRKDEQYSIALYEFAGREIGQSGWQRRHVHVDVKKSEFQNLHEIWKRMTKETKHQQRYTFLMGGKSYYFLSRLDPGLMEGMSYSVDEEPILDNFHKLTNVLMDMMEDNRFEYSKIKDLVKKQGDLIKKYYED